MLPVSQREVHTSILRSSDAHCVSLPECATDVFHTILPGPSLDSVALSLQLRLTAEQGCHSMIGRIYGWAGWFVFVIGVAATLNASDTAQMTRLTQVDGSDSGTDSLSIATAASLGDQNSISASPHAGHLHVRPFATLAVYSILIAAASLFGGWLPGHIHISHTGFQLLISLVGGLLLGVGVFHLLTHSVYEMGSQRIDVVACWMMGGMLLMFFLLRAFHVHHHEPPEEGIVTPNSMTLPVLHDLSNLTVVEAHVHHDGCQHHPPHVPGVPHGRLGWIGLFFGLGVHTLLDGLALGAAMQSDADHGVQQFVAIGVMLGIALHKPLDSLSITTLMIHAGQPPATRWVVNVAYACLCPFAAALFLSGIPTGSESSQLIIGACLAFSSGAFICLALADLLPEMEFHSHDRLRLSAALALGIFLAWAIRYLEPSHLHQATIHG